jgi:7-cyano-7-deazaguanine synthase
MSRGIVVFSGGPDSTAAALWAIEQGIEVELLTFQTKGSEQYGELYASMTVAAALKLPQTIVDFKEPLTIFSPLVHPFVHAGTPRDLDKTKDHILPFGAGSMLAFASSYAVYNQALTLVWGATADDAANNVDYTQAFADGLARLVSLATGVNFSILLPFVKYHKPVLMEKYKGKEKLLSLTWSCKKPSENVQCGACSACLARRFSADLARIADETRYKKKEFSNPIPLSDRPKNLLLSEEQWESLIRRGPGMDSALDLLNISSGSL